MRTACSIPDPSTSSLNASRRNNANLVEQKNIFLKYFFKKIGRRKSVNVLQNCTETIKIKTFSSILSAEINFFNLKIKIGFEPSEAPYDGDINAAGQFIPAEVKPRRSWLNKIFIDF